MRTLLLDFNFLLRCTSATFLSSGSGKGDRRRRRRGGGGGEGGGGGGRGNGWTGMVGYGDAHVEEEDVELLESDGWINDALILFFQEFLRLEVARGDPRVAFVSPNVAFLCAHSDESMAQEILMPLGLPEMGLIMVPTNDTLAKSAVTTYQNAIGSHWTLVVYHNRLGILEFNSLPSGTVSPAAETIGKILSSALNKNIPVRLGVSPQQTNSYDCGVYVCAMMEDLLHYFLEDDRLIQFRGFSSDALTADIISTKRQEIKSLILSHCVRR